MKGPSKYITTLSSNRWECWRDDWMLVQTDTHERLTLPTAAPMAPRIDWEQDPGLEPVFNPVRVRQRPQQMLKTILMAGPMGGAAGRSGSVHH
jgi:hypothetical protein